MAKGRKRSLSDSDISDIIFLLCLNDGTTKREIAMKYEIHLSTLYKYLPQYLKNPTPKREKVET